MLIAQQLVSQSVFNAVSIADIKAHLNVTDTTTDSYIGSLLAAAVTYCERYTGLDFRATTWNQIMDQMPIFRNYGWYDKWGNAQYSYPWTAEFAIGRVTQRWQVIDLMRGPVQSVSYIKYYDITNALQTLDPSNYTYVLPSFRPATIEPTQYWPISYPRPDSVTVQYVTGFTTLPDNLKHAIRLLCGYYFSAREDLAYGPQTVGANIGGAVDCLLDQFRPGGYN